MPDLKLIYPLANWKTTGTFRELYNLGDGLYEHPGCDGVPASGAGVGAPVLACDDARVHAVHLVGDGWGDGSFGNCIILDHEGTPYYTITAHHQAIYVSAGDRVKRGQVIGTMGMTGRTTGPHVHWGMDENDGFPPKREQDSAGIWRITSGTMVDPEMYVQPLVRLLTIEERVARIERIVAGSVDTTGDGKPDLEGEAAIDWIDKQGIRVVLTAQRQNKAMTGELKE